MEEKDPIVEFKRFETAIDANIAKTKLDAYGIPCFLSDENLANLYPIQNPRFSVRLHVFEKDILKVQEILNEKIVLPEDEALFCPQCKSTRIKTDYTKKFSWRFLTILFSLLVTILPLKKMHRCNDCNFEF